MLEYLPYILILIGLTVIVVLIFLNRRIRKYWQAVSNMLALSDEHEFNLSPFLKDIEPILKRLGIDDFAYHIEYLNVTLHKDAPEHRHNLQKKWSQNPAIICLTFYFSSRPRGENRAIFHLLLEILLMIIRHNIFTRQLIVQQTFDRLHKINAFVLHDVKNLAQFIVFLNHNLNNLCSPDEQRDFIQTLKETMPALTIRAARIMGFFQKTGPDNNLLISVLSDKTQKQGQISLTSLINVLHKQYNFPLTIKGNISIHQKTADQFMAVLDNILKNIHDKSQQAPLRCQIIMYEKNNEKILKIIDTGGQCANIERIFEPFYTTKKQGLGIGLFQAREVMKKLGGKITARNIRHGIMFEIRLPVK